MLKYLHMATLEDQREDIISNLEKLNNSMDKQNSVRHTVRNGLIYGISFVVGSTILATIVLGTLVKFFGDLPFIGQFL
jgi:hypothetical protein